MNLFLRHISGTTTVLPCAQLFGLTHFASSLINETASFSYTISPNFAAFPLPLPRTRALRSPESLCELRCSAHRCNPQGLASDLSPFPGTPSQGELAPPLSIPISPSAILSRVISDRLSRRQRHWLLQHERWDCSARWRCPCEVDALVRRVLVDRV